MSIGMICLLLKEKELNLNVYIGLQIKYFFGNIERIS